MSGDSLNLNANKLSEVLVTENLKTLRVLHQLLMAVAAGILAFALRPDLSNDYKAALNELSELREVSFDGWGKFIIDRYKSDEERNQKLVLAVIHFAGLPIEGSPKLNPPIYGEPPPYLGTAKLLEFDAFLTGSRKIGTIRINANPRKVAEQLKRAVASRNAHPVVSGMWLEGFAAGVTPLVNGVRMLDWRNPSPAPTATLNFSINDQPQTIPNAPVYVIVTYEINSESGQFAAEWFRTEVFGQKLIDPNSGAVFPNLKRFWDKVNSLPVDQATALLQSQLELSTRGTVSFFGIPVERSLAVFAGPVVSLSILLFLCLHLRHFRSVSADGNAIRNYPWVPVFKGVWGVLVACGTLVALPVVANEELLRRLGRWREPSTQVGLVSAILIVGAGVWSVVEVQRLRSRAFK
jgi:hypothetical protein